jgi:DNA invertase Pin-like site-specific DNA recombinase
MRAIIYARLPSTEQASNSSLDNQWRACDDYCRREGIEVDAVIAEGQGGTRR